MTDEKGDVGEPMETFKIRELIIGRRKQCGVGLARGYGAIARWLFKKHNIVTSTSWIADVIAATPNRKYHD